MPAIPFSDWERPAVPLRDDDAETACEDCIESQARLARANQLLRAIARGAEPKPAKAEMLDDPLEALIVGYACAFAAIRVRIELYLRSIGTRL